MRQQEHHRFHGRYASEEQICQWVGCCEAGEFRAPGLNGHSCDGPGEYLWFCLQHVRSFNAGYNYFEGMDADEIAQAQSPIHGWETESRAFRYTAGIDEPPRWADFSDPLEAIQQRARARMKEARDRAKGLHVSAEQKRALEVLNVAPDAGAKALRSRYLELVRRYHPDRNGGDRSFESKLRAVMEAYDLLKIAPFFS